VSFEFYDYVTDTYSIKKILGVEFHILFRQHILPSRLPRCRMSGLFASGSRRDGRLELCRQLINEANRINEANQQASNDAQSLRPDSDLPLADTTEDELVDTRSIVACKECGVEMSQSYSIKGREICSTLRLVPLVLAALAATTSLMIAEAIKLVVEARLQVGGSQRYKISLCVFLSSEYHYDEQLHLTLSTLVAQALPEPIATPPTPRGHHKPSTSRGVFTTDRTRCHPERFIYRHDRTGHPRCNSHRHIAQRHTFSSFGIQSRANTWHARTTRREKRCHAHKSLSAHCRHCIALGNLGS
jgi:hypothetical protein